MSAKKKQMETKVKIKRKTRSTKNQVAQIYLIEAIGLFRYKIGWAFSAEDRLKTLKRAQPCVNYQILKVFNCYNAEGIETMLHKRYAAYQVQLEHSEEWFELPNNVLQEVLEIYEAYKQKWESENQNSSEPIRLDLRDVLQAILGMRTRAEGTFVDELLKGFVEEKHPKKKITPKSVLLGGLKLLLAALIGGIKLIGTAAISSRKSPRFQVRGSGGRYYGRQHSKIGRLGAMATAFFIAFLIVTIFM